MLKNVSLPLILHGFIAWKEALHDALMFMSIKDGRYKCYARKMVLNIIIGIKLTK